MNEDFDKNICEAAERGLTSRYRSEASPAAVEAVMVAVRRRARQVRLMRSIRHLSAVVVPAAACAAFIFMTLDAPVRPSVSGERKIELGSMTALVALTTLVSDYDATSVTNADVVLADMEYGSDLDSFADNLVLMQDSACVMED